MQLLGNFTMDDNYYLMMVDFQKLEIDYEVVIPNGNGGRISTEIYVAEAHYQQAVRIMSNVQAGMIA